MCYNKSFLWRNLCSVRKKKQHNIGFPTFKLPASTDNLLEMTR